MLQAAAERGVKINVIVYKEVEAALTLDSAVCNAKYSIFLAYFEISSHCSYASRVAHQACPREAAPQY
jgi:hypothetical protein